MNNINCLKSLPYPPSNRTNYSISFFFTFIALKITTECSLLSFIFLKYCDITYMQPESPLIKQCRQKRSEKLEVPILKLCWGFLADS